MLGIINAVVVSKGRYGRTREIKSDIGHTLRQKIKVILTHELNI